MIFDKKEIEKLEKVFKKRIEYVVFNTHRAKKKVKGGHTVDDDTGKLRKKIKSARGFITQDKKGNLLIEFPVTEYYKYLDEERRDALNWYLTDAMFDDKIINNEIRKIYTETTKKAIISMVEEINNKKE